jgi:hypothetical protein
LVPQVEITENNGGKGKKHENNGIMVLFPLTNATESRIVNGGGFVSPA